MASNNISVNLSRPNTVKGRSSKNTVERTKRELIATNISSASNDKKMILYWKKSKEVKLLANIWHVKERESQDVQIYLYVYISNDNGIYEVLGKVIDMCSVLDSEVVYILTNPTSHMKGLNTNYHIHCTTRERYLQIWVNKS